MIRADQPQYGQASGFLPLPISVPDSVGKIGTVLQRFCSTDIWKPG